MIRRNPLILALLLLGLLLPATSRAAPADTPRVLQQGGGVQLEWNGAPAALENPAATLVAIGGSRLPAQLVALRVAGSAPIAIHIDHLSSAPWSGALAPAERPVPQLPGGPARPDLAAAPGRALPEAPVLLLREGYLRGARIAVLALSPLFEAPGGPRAVASIRASVASATLLDSDTARLLAAAGPFLAEAPAGNPAAGTGWKVRVTQAGIQRLSASALAAAGVPLATPENLHLRLNGAELAIDQRGSGGSLELRFYAATPGDRWNGASTYWLTLEDTPGARMATRSVAPGNAELSLFALERGVWRDNKLYDSLLPGPDADHWFAADMRIDPAPPGQPQVPPVVTSITITPALTMVLSQATVAAAGSSYLATNHTLQIGMGGAAATSTWSGAGDWEQAQIFDQPSKQIKLVLPSTASADGYEIDHVAWEVPVSLDLGGRGAAFVGRAGAWRYRLYNPPAGGVLYDVSDPAAPQILSGLQALDATTSEFQDGPDQRSYVLAGTTGLPAPAISRSQAFDFATPARAVYIAPAALHDALAPLVKLRQAQGYTTRIVDVQSIYDMWSYGQVSPQAIRDFLRYTAASWPTPPDGVTLVGDGTSDPMNYTHRNNTNYIPPFLANVDPWVGETACETCFVRLQGDDPLADPLPDLAIGRLPARSPAELVGMVNKIVAYETSPLDLTWRSRSIYIADNYRDSQGKPDSAGDFTAFADASIAQQPADIRISRMYYDPQAPAGQPWRERDALKAYQRTLALLGAGAGLANYIGHGSLYQWAVTDYTANPPYLLGQYDPDDLANGSRQPILLEMTCLTGAFQTPSYGGTIDERMLLNPKGGAIAIWSSAGQGVSHGHDALQRGFYSALWAAPPLTARVGDLTLAGYTELFANGSCCQDAISTYGLLGDALMTARVLPARQLFLPVARRTP